MTEFNLSNVLSSSKSIIDKAFLDFDPKSVVVAFSGGDDSLTAMEVLKHFGIKPDFAIFANTLTGIPATLNFVKKYCKENDIKLLVTRPKKTLEDMVYKDGFLGIGNNAHNIAFGELKGKPIRNKISSFIRKKRQNYNVLIFSGLRRSESSKRSNSQKYQKAFWQERAKKTKDGVQKYSPDIWCSVILDWEKEDCIEFLEWKKVERNPVSIALGRSGDCHCGTAIGNPEKEFKELSEWAPEVAKEISSLDTYCVEKGLTRWCEKRNKYSFLEKNGQLNMFEGLDLCSGCKARYTFESKK